MTNTLHAHVSSTSVDCDGPIHRSHIDRFNDDENAEHLAAEAKGGVNDFSDIHFMNRVFTNNCGPFAVEAMTITMDKDSVEWNERTDEGYRAGTITWCNEICDDGRYNTYRDVRAEEAGY